MNIFNRVAYDLLRKQKETLINLANNEELLPRQEREHLDGIINFLDAFQDAAVGEGGISQERVFSKKEQV